MAVVSVGAQSDQVPADPGQRGRFIIVLKVSGESKRWFERQGNFLGSFHKCPQLIDQLMNISGDFFFQRV